MVNVVLKYHVNHLTQDVEFNIFQKRKFCCGYLLQIPQEHAQSACSICCVNEVNGRRHKDN